MSDRVGQQLGNYRLTRLLGRGGFAEVYLGEHIRLKTLAAIKVMQTQLEGREEEEFLKEAQTVAGLEHPNIVRILDFDFAEGVPFLVMSFASKGTLRDRYAKGASVPLPTAVAFVKQIADALNYAHDEKVIHRDIKPENMLLGRRDEILLTDFGIATMAQSSRYQSTQNMAGTVTYMSPEQIQGKPRPASDQYSLAIVVYEWLSGSRPFHGSFTEIATQQIFSAPPPLREKVPEISPALEFVVMTALKKDPHERFASVKAFAVALEQASQESTTQAMTTPRAIRSSPPRDAGGSAEILPSMPAVPFVGAAGPSLAKTPAVISPGTLLLTYRGHTQPVESVAWSLDGRYLASASDDGTVQIWEALTGRCVHIYRGHTGEIAAIAWSPDGSLIASASEDRTVQIWGAMTGYVKQVYRGHSGGVWSVAWSPDGDSIASGSDDRSVHVWDITSGETFFIRDGLARSVLTLAWSPDDQYLVFQGGETALQLCDSVDGHNIRNYRGHRDSVWSIACHPQGTCIASGGENIQIWAPNGRTLLINEVSAERILAVAWSPDGTYIACGGEDRTIRIWDSTNNNEIFSYNGHEECVTTIAWSPDGTMIASGGEDNDVQVWATPWHKNV